MAGAQLISCKYQMELKVPNTPDTEVYEPHCITASNNTIYSPFEDVSPGPSLNVMDGPHQPGQVPESRDRTTPIISPSISYSSEPRCQQEISSRHYHNMSESGCLSYVREGRKYTVIVDQPSHQNVYVQTKDLDLSNWLVPAIVSCVCCINPVGIFAVVAATKANIAVKNGDIKRAVRKTRQARMLTMAAFTIGTAYCTYFIIYKFMIAILNKE